MPIAFITIDNIDKQDPSYIHFSDKSQKKWNCTKPELFRDDNGGMAWGPGTRLKIDYNEAAPKPPAKYGAKYVNNARQANANDPSENGQYGSDGGLITAWPDKEPYQGGGSYSGGSKVSKDNYDPEVSKRQTAANCAMAWCSANITNVDELGTLFPAVADTVLKWVNESPKSGAGQPAEESYGDF